MHRDVSYSDLTELIDSLLSSEEELNLEESQILDVWLFECEVCNGGFYQFFYNETGKRNAQTLVALSEISAEKHFNLLQQATRKVNSDQEINSSDFEELDNQYFELQDSEPMEDFLLKKISSEWAHVVFKIVLKSAIVESDCSFRENNFKNVIKCLEPYSDSLPKSSSLKLNMARKKLSAIN